MNVNEVIDSNRGFAFSKLEKMFWFEVLSKTLRRTGGNKTRAADLLGINRSTLKKWCDVTGIDSRDFK